MSECQSFHKISATLAVNYESDGGGRGEVPMLPMIEKFRLYLFQFVLSRNISDYFQ